MDVMMSDGVTCVCLCQRVLRCSRLNGSFWIYLHVGGSTTGRVPLSLFHHFSFHRPLSLTLPDEAIVRIPQQGYTA